MISLPFKVDCDRCYARAKSTCLVDAYSDGRLALRYPEEMTPRGWGRRYVHGAMAFTCPKCLADEAHRRQLTVYDRPDMPPEPGKE